MFEFGKDLRKIFAQARESDDLSWLELIGVNLVEVEARQQSVDAGRVSCKHPVEASLRASAFWREHARRCGHPVSLERAAAAVTDARRRAVGDQIAETELESARVDMLRFDLCGDVAVLDRAFETVAAVDAPRSIQTATTAAALHARLSARRARLSDDPAALLDAAALMDAALHDLQSAPADHVEDVRMDRAALALETGVVRRDPRLLDQAGRDLLALVESASPDYRPLTRARALALCGAGLAALAAVAGDESARLQGQALFDAAVDQFTPDHSPLDWAAIQILRADDPETPTKALIEAEALTAGGGLILGALAREARTARAVQEAEDHGDLTALAAVAARLRVRLQSENADAAPLDWAADQIGLARVGLAVERLCGHAPPGVTLALSEAADVARCHGVPTLAQRAEGLIKARA